MATRTTIQPQGYHRYNFGQFLPPCPSVKMRQFVSNKKPNQSYLPPHPRDNSFSLPRVSVRKLYNAGGKRPKPVSKSCEGISCTKLPEIVGAEQHGDDGDGRERVIQNGDAWWEWKRKQYEIKPTDFHRSSNHQVDANFCERVHIRRQPYYNRPQLPPIIQANDRSDKHKQPYKERDFSYGRFQVLPPTGLSILQNLNDQLSPGLRYYYSQSKSGLRPIHQRRTMKKLSLYDFNGNSDLPNAQHQPLFSSNLGAAVKQSLAKFGESNNQVIVQDSRDQNLYLKHKEAKLKLRKLQAELLEQMINLLEKSKHNPRRGGEDSYLNSPVPYPGTNYGVGHQPEGIQVSVVDLSWFFDKPKSDIKKYEQNMRSLHKAALSLSKSVKDAQKMTKVHKSKDNPSTYDHPPVAEETKTMAQLLAIKTLNPPDLGSNFQYGRRDYVVANSFIQEKLHTQSGGHLDQTRQQQAHQASSDKRNVCLAHVDVNAQYIASLLNLEVLRRKEIPSLRRDLNRLRKKGVLFDGRERPPNLYPDMVITGESLALMRALGLNDEEIFNTASGTGCDLQKLSDKQLSKLQEVLHGSQADKRMEQLKDTDEDGKEHAYAREHEVSVEEECEMYEPMNDSIQLSTSEEEIRAFSEEIDGETSYLLSQNVPFEEDNATRECTVIPPALNMDILNVDLFEKLQMKKLERETKILQTVKNDLKYLQDTLDVNYVPEEDETVEDSNDMEGEDLMENEDNLEADENQELSKTEKREENKEEEQQQEQEEKGDNEEEEQVDDVGDNQVEDSCNTMSVVGDYQDLPTRSESEETINSRPLTDINDSGNYEDNGSNPFIEDEYHHHQDNLIPVKDQLSVVEEEPYHETNSTKEVTSDEVTKTSTQSSKSLSKAQAAKKTKEYKRVFNNVRMGMDLGDNKQSVPTRNFLKKGEAQNRVKSKSPYLRNRTSSSNVRSAHERVTPWSQSGRASPRLRSGGRLRTPGTPEFKTGIMREIGEVTAVVNTIKDIVGPLEISRPQTVKGFDIEPRRESVGSRSGQRSRQFTRESMRGSRCHSSAVIVEDVKEEIDDEELKRQRQKELEEELCQSLEREKSRLLRQRRFEEEARKKAEDLEKERLKALKAQQLQEALKAAQEKERHDKLIKRLKDEAEMRQLQLLYEQEMVRERERMLAVWNEVDYAYISHYMGEDFSTKQRQADKTIELETKKYLEKQLLDALEYKRRELLEKLKLAQEEFLRGVAVESEDLNHLLQISRAFVFSYFGNVPEQTYRVPEEIF